MNKIVVFKVANQEYGIDIMKVLEIIDYREITPLPEVPDYIEGMVNIRSDIYPIFNLRKRFHLKTGDLLAENIKIILMNLEEIKVGFVVDDVCEILSLTQEDIEAKPKMLTRYDSKYITGVTKYSGRMILLLDIDLLVTEKEQELLAEVIGQ